MTALLASLARGIGIDLDVIVAFNRKSSTLWGGLIAHFVGASCKKGYLDTVRQLKCWLGHVMTTRQGI